MLDRGRAEAFLRTQARPLERALFAFRCGTTPAGDALAALAEFRNDDGGFGRGLEPDFPLPDSSSLATAVALQLLRELDAPADHLLVRGAMDYTVRSLDRFLGCWPAVPPEVNHHPHAPWWTWKPSPTPGFAANPGAETIAHLWHYAEAVPSEFLAETMRALEAAWADLPPKPEMHDLLCWLWVARTPAVPATLRERVLAWSRSAAAETVAREPASWRSYGLKPTAIAPEAERPWASDLAEPLAAQLDFEMARQGDDGAWAPNGSWSGAYPKTWPQAEREWKGVLTLRTLMTLRAYGRWE